MRVSSVVVPCVKSSCTWCNRCLPSVKDMLTGCCSVQEHIRPWQQPWYLGTGATRRTSFVVAASL